MSQQKALFLQAKQGNFEVVETTIPKPGSGEILVKIHSTGLNPLDWKIQKYGIIVENYPAILGFEASGVIEEAGEGVTNLKKGDKVLFQATSTKEHATYQQYATVPAEIAAKVPENITFDQAATVPVGLLTAALGLYQGAGLTAPWAGGEGKHKGESILVFGGSSSMGQYVIQWAKLSGFSTIATTASAHHTELLKSLGATHIIDRKADVTAEVRKIISPLPKVIFDAISEDTQEQAWEILPPGGTLLLLLPPHDTLTNSATDGKKFFNVFSSPYAHREFSVGLYAHITEYLASGKIIPNRVEVLPNGLAGVVGGLELSFGGKVSGKKLVARPQETA